MHECRGRIDARGATAFAVRDRLRRQGCRRNHGIVPDAFPSVALENLAGASTGGWRGHLTRMTSLPVKILVGTATVAVLYALYLDTRKQKQTRQLVARVKDLVGDNWQSLSWQSRVLVPRVGLRLLFKRSAVNDTESRDRYEALRRIERKQAGALILFAAAIIVILLGTRHWGWNW
jgi:hypothetical protein